MFTTKPESGEKITKLGGGVGDAKTPFTERPATYASKKSRSKCEQDGPVNYRRGLDDQRQRHPMMLIGEEPWSYRVTVTLPWRGQLGLSQ